MRSMAIYSGGTSINDIPEPNRYMWPDSDEQREVVIKVTSYIGFSAFANHYYAKITEGDNLVWDSGEAAE